MKQQLIACLVIVLGGCHSPTGNETSTQPHTFDRPQALIFVDDDLLVSESAYGPDGWATGYVSLIDPDSATFTKKWPTTQKNPQRIRRHGETIYVINSGEFDFSDFSNPRALTGGGVDLLNSTSIQSANPVVDNWPIPVPITSEEPVSPIDIAFGNEEVLITSALKPSVWFSPNRQLPIELTPIRFNSNTVLGLGSVVSWENHFLVVDFNSDRALIIDQQGRLMECEAALGGAEIAIEGSQSPVVHDDELFVLMSLSGRVIALDLPGFLNDCDIRTRVVVPSTGQVPNDMHIGDDGLYIVNSGDNNVIRYSLSSGEEMKRWVLPVGSNPWHIAFDDRNRFMAVSEWGANAVSIIDLDNDSIRRVSSNQTSYSESDPGSIP